MCNGKHRHTKGGQKQRGKQQGKSSISIRITQLSQSWRNIKKKGNLFSA